MKMGKHTAMGGRPWPSPNNSPQILQTRKCLLHAPPPKPSIQWVTINIGGRETLTRYPQWVQGGGGGQGPKSSMDAPLAPILEKLHARHQDGVPLGAPSFVPASFDAGTLI